MTQLVEQRDIASCAARSCGYAVFPGREICGYSLGSISKFPCTGIASDPELFRKVVGNNLRRILNAGVTRLALGSCLRYRFRLVLLKRLHGSPGKPAKLKYGRQGGFLDGPLAACPERLDTADGRLKRFQLILHTFQQFLNPVEILVIHMDINVFIVIAVGIAVQIHNNRIRIAIVDFFSGQPDQLYVFAVDFRLDTHREVRSRAHGCLLGVRIKHPVRRLNRKIGQISIVHSFTRCQQSVFCRVHDGGAIVHHVIHPGQLDRCSGVRLHGNTLSERLCGRQGFDSLIIRCQLRLLLLSCSGFRFRSGLRFLLHFLSDFCPGLCTDIIHSGFSGFIQSLLRCLLLLLCVP